jgi:DNA-binding transcriptional LysR family regulator
MLAIRLPLYPRLGIRLKTQFAIESVHSVLVGEVNLALVTAPPQDAQITAVPFAPAPLYAVLAENHPAAHKERLVLQDLAKDEWILFPKRFEPVVFEAIMDAAQRGSIAPKHAHDAIAPQQGADLVSEHAGVAILTQPSAPGFHPDGTALVLVTATDSSPLVVCNDLIEVQVRHGLGGAGWGRRYCSSPLVSLATLTRTNHSPARGLRETSHAVEDRRVGSCHHLRGAAVPTTLRFSSATGDFQRI